MKRSAQQWKSERGSAQVIEFSYVFPAAALTVIALLYLTFALFFYVYAFNQSELAADRAFHAVGGERVYWQLSSCSADPKTEKKIAGDLEKRMDRMAVLPGIHFDTSLKESGAGARVTASVSCSYFGKTVFSVRSVRDMLKPTEFAQNTDLLSDVLSDTGIREKLNKKFGNFLQRDKTYEIF